MTSDTTRDYEHLKLLSIFHYVLGGLVGAVSLFPIFHIGIGASMLMWPENFHDDQGEVPPEFVGWLFVIIGGVIILLGLTLAICLILSGRGLAKHKGYWFSVVVACLECLNMPLGTVLGVFTLVVLWRPSVKEIYGISSSSSLSA